MHYMYILDIFTINSITCTVCRWTFSSMIRLYSFAEYLRFYTKPFIFQFTTRVGLFAEIDSMTVVECFAVFLL